MDAGETFPDGEVRSGFVSGNTFGYRPVQYHVVDGLAMFEGDIVLGTVEEMERTAAAVANLPGGGAAAAVIITGSRFRWPGGVVPFTIDPRLPDVARVEQAIAHWHSRTQIRIVPRTDQENFVTFRPGSGCSSPIGMRGGQQFITLADGCGRGQAIHEIGHTVGLWHEQSREDRDQFIRVLTQNIEPDKVDDFRQHITDGDDVGPYDFGSIMHYGTHFFSRNGQPTLMTLHGEAIGQRNALSDGDIQAVNAMYSPSVSLPATLGTGVYTIQQQSNGRFVDAHEITEKDFALVTWPAQNNSTQRWVIKRVWIRTRLPFLADPVRRRPDGVAAVEVAGLFAACDEVEEKPFTPIRSRIASSYALLGALGHAISMRTRHARRSRSPMCLIRMV